MSPILLVSTLLLLSAPPRASEDREYIQALLDAQRGRPSQLTSSSRIAPEGEPGTALVVHGRAFAADGKSPLTGAVVFAYHTDRTGVYDRRGTPAHSWRLKGWAKTDSEGRFEFRTIRPGPYPGRRQAAHIHLTLFTADGSRHHAGGVLFADDPLVGAEEREATQRDAVFGSVRPVRREGAVEHIDVNVRAQVGQRF
jgi:protocatechuate 3,4-dioxygenase beta subunit